MNNFAFNAIIFAPLFVGLIVSQIVRFDLKAFQGLYLLLAAANILVWYFMLDGRWLEPVIFAAIGFVTLLVATGIFGTKVRAADYVFAQIGIGMYPWTLFGFSGAVIYVVLLGIFVTLVALRPKFKNPFFKNGTK